jgi:hypothetical protein
VCRRLAAQPPAALLIVSGPGEIHEHAAHQPSGHGEEVRAILPLDPTNINQPEVGLVDEGGGLQNMVATLASHVPLREVPQFPVHEGQQFLDGPFVAALHSTSRAVTSWVLTSDTVRPFYARRT